MKWVKRVLLAILLLILVLVGIQYFQYRNGIAVIKKQLPGNGLVIETTQGPVEYLINGNTNRYVLLIHGTPGSYRTFMAEALVDRGLTVVSPSRPGYFRTPLESGVTIPEQADLYAALLDALHIDSVAIIGFSGGGPSALEFAIRHPDRCSHLVVMSSAGRYFEGSPRPWLQEAILSSEFGKWTMFGALTAGFADSESGLKGLEYVRSAMFPVDHTEKGEQNDMEQFTTPASYALDEIKCPVLIIHGTKDELIPFAEATHLDTTIPNSRLLAKENQDHFTVVFFEFRENLDIAAAFILEKGD